MQSLLVVLVDEVVLKQSHFVFIVVILNHQITASLVSDDVAVDVCQIEFNELTTSQLRLH